MRFKHIVQDASLRVVVTEETLKERFQLLQIETLCFQGLEKESGEEPEIETSAGAPASILYRSGATGTPEGVVLSHQALCGGGSGTEITATDRVAQKIDFSRETGSLEVFRTLSRGRHCHRARLQLSFATMK
jgi:long-subunit acyl-CoA synthetase (AMP-forming)